MVESLQYLWPCVEAVNPVFSRAAIIRWPDGVHDKLVAAGLVVPQGTTTRIRCPECGRTHVAKPIVRTQPNGSARVFIPCPENVRAEVKNRDLEQWAANIQGLVSAVAKSLSLGGKIASLESDRIWRCGRWMFQGVQREVLFARGLRRKDASGFRRAISGAHRPVVFVASEIPDPEFWQGRIPPLIRLREVATLVDRQVSLDGPQIIGLVGAADEHDEDQRIRSRKNQQKTIRRAVKQEIKSFVEDDALVAAYKIHGSLDKAVAGLAEQGVETDRWAIERALDRAGGIEEVMSREDSESIVRSRTSHRRDTPIEKRD